MWKDFYDRCDIQMAFEEFERYSMEIQAFFQPVVALSPMLNDRWDGETDFTVPKQTPFFAAKPTQPKNGTK